MLDTEELRLRRETLGLSMDAAAQKAGMGGRQQWHYIESGIRSDIQLSTLEKIAKALECNPCDLLLKEKPPTGKRASPAKGKTAKKG